MAQSPPILTWIGGSGSRFQLFQVLSALGLLLGGDRESHTQNHQTFEKRQAETVGLLDRVSCVELGKRQDIENSRH